MVATAFRRFREMPLFLKRRAGVAVVEIEGVIGTRVRVPAYTRLFDSVAQSTRYRALLLDIDSPGGPPPARRFSTGA
jgi:ClpP class serine protease